MKTFIRMVAPLSLALPVLLTGLLPLSSQAQTQPAPAAITIGGLPVVTITRKPVSKTRPEFTSITVAPGRGMQVIQITANIPGKGEMDVLLPRTLAQAKQTLDVDDDSFGNLGFRLGAALLVPYPNRIIGKVSADGQTVTTYWEGHKLVLPANWVGKLPGAERHAMHGLILKAKVNDVHVEKIPGGEEVTGILHAGDFGGHWLSKTDLTMTFRLTAEAVDATIVAKNVGSEAEPMAIGWHPYFNLPSGDREQVRIHIPGTMLTQVNNHDSVFPTGKLLPVKGTRYDFTAPGGRALDKNFYDDNWSHLIWKNGAVTVRIVDPKAHYGVKIEGLSPQIRTLQLYAPVDESFVAFEDQYNFADPFGKEWGKMNTGMVTLAPGQSTKWHVRLKVFVP